MALEKESFTQTVIGYAWTSFSSFSAR